MNKTMQLEMSLNNSLPYRRPSPSEQRRRRAQWWFAQMRRVVDHALDWRAAPAPRPEQTYLYLASSH
jgi:hypothetical protein